MTPREIISTLGERAGRRGAFLAFLAVLDMAYGWSLIADPTPAQFRHDLVLPQIVWGWAWLGVGLVCALRIFGRRDRVAFALAAALKCAWGLIFIRVWLAEHQPRGFVAPVIWLSFAATVLIISGWPEQPRDHDPVI